MPPRKKTDTVHVNLRMREQLRDRLDKAAKKADRSLNAEMVDRLEKSFDLPEMSFGGPENVLIMRKLAAQMDIEKTITALSEGRRQPSARDLEGLLSCFAEILAMVAPKMHSIALFAEEPDFRKFRGVDGRKAAFFLLPNASTNTLFSEPNPLVRLLGRIMGSKEAERQEPSK